MIRIAALAAAAAATALAPSAAQAQTPPAPSTEIVDLASDRHDRLTVAVQIGEAGPFRFLIDTAAERTVLSRGVAERLGLAPSGRVAILGIAGRLAVDTVEVDEVRIGRRSFYGIRAPLLETANLGADGIVGLDGLQGQRVLLDFGNEVMAVDGSRALGGDSGFEIVVRARRRGSQLIMTNAVVDGVRTAVVIDTGSQVSIANPALREKLARRRALMTTALVSATGQEIPADMVVVRETTLGRLRLGNLVLAFTDSPTFGWLGLGEKPAILLGMNELRAFKRVAIDFDSRTVLFDLAPPQPGLAAR